MNVEITTGRIGVLALVAMLIAGAGIGMAAVGNDTETSTSSSQSDLADGDHITVNATEDTEYNLQGTGMTSDGEFRLKHDDTVVHTESSLTEVDESNGHYNATLTASEIRSNVPLTAGENTSVTVVIVDNTTLDESNQSTATYSVDVEGDGLLTRVVDSDADPFLSLEDDRRMVPFTDFSVFGDKSATIEFDGLNASANDTVSVFAEQENASERLSVSDLSSEVPIIGQTAQVDGDYVPLYHDAAPSDADGTYVLKEDGEYTVQSDESVDSVTISSDGFGITDAYAAYKAYGDIGILTDVVGHSVSGLSPFSLSGFGGFTAALFGGLVARRRIGA